MPKRKKMAKNSQPTTDAKQTEPMMETANESMPEMGNVGKRMKKDQNCKNSNNSQC